MFLSIMHNQKKISGKSKLWNILYLYIYIKTRIFHMSLKDGSKLMTEIVMDLRSKEIRQLNANLNPRLAAEI